MTLVLDASVVVPACTRPNGFAAYVGEHLVAPALMWSEARSVLHRAVWQGLASREIGARSLERLEHGPVERGDSPELGFAAWRVADELGWATTYDAEYVALAQILGCRLVTVDARLRRGADRLGFVVGPSEL